MSTIRNLFETTRSLDRRIEKVISFDNAARRARPSCSTITPENVSV